MTKHMNKIEKLIDEICPEGVEFKELGEICTSITAGGDLPEQYIKGQKSPSNKFPFPIYSNGSEDKALYGFTNDYKINQDAVTISARGTIGFHAVRRAKFTPIVRLITLIPDNSITVEFLNYVLDITEIGHSGGSIPQLTVPNVKKIKIPIPLLPIQQEIVKILDTFSALEAELQTELEARKKQYEYYYDQVFTFDNKVEIKKINEVSIVFDSLHQTPKYSDTGFPMIRVTDIKGGYINTENALKVDRETFEIFTKKYKPQFNDIVISRVGSYGNFSLIWQEEVCLGQNTAIIHPLINAKYLYYALHSKNVTQFVENNVGGGSQKTISLASIKEIPIHVPPLTEQQRIVSILDKFDALVNDISVGLPAEINARRNQYEYYRNKLLTFKPLEKDHA